MTTQTFVRILKYTAVAVAGFAMGYWLRGCSCPEPCKEAVSDTITVTEYDTTVLTKDVIRPLVKWQKVDTAAIVAERDRINAMTLADQEKAYWDLFFAYYTENGYDSIVKNDTSAYLRLRAVAYQNQVQLLGVDLINRRPTAVTKQVNIVDPTRNRVYVGGGVSYSFGETQPFGLQAGLTFVSKKSLMVGVWGDPFQQQVGINAGVKLSFRKR